MSSSLDWAEGGNTRDRIRRGFGDPEHVLCAVGARRQRAPSATPVIAISRPIPGYLSPVFASCKRQAVRSGVLLGLTSFVANADLG